MEPILACNSLSKTFDDGHLRVQVLQDISLQVAKGESLAIIGASGSGKSTLLHLLGGLDSVSSGQVWLKNKDMQKMRAAEQGEWRNRYLGFVYQFHHLLPEFTALENVAMPLWIRRMPEADAVRSATAVLNSIGLGDRLAHRPSELSGGERQRVAIARALVTMPACVLADEPTGNLDRSTAQEVLALMLDLARQIGTAFIVVTHDHDIASRCNRILRLTNGVLQNES